MQVVPQLPWRQVRGFWRRAHLVRPLAVVYLFAMALLVSGGCGPRTDRLGITGEVTLSGVPLDGGSIRFTSEGAEKLMSAGAVIQDGRYDIPREKGLRPGTYRVEITAPDSDGPPVMVKVKPNQPPIALPRERIPPEFNKNSQQTREVTTDGDNHFVFKIAG